MYIKFDESGNYGFYTPEIHGEDFCKRECIEISDDLYNYLLESQGKYLVDVNSVDGAITRENLVTRPEEIVEEPMPTLEERLQNAEDTILYLLVNGGM